MKRKRQALLNTVARKIEEHIIDSGISKKYCADKLGLKYKTFADKIYFNRLTIEDKTKLAELLGFNLAELEQDFKITG